MVCIFDPACELLLPWTKELYLCTVAPVFYVYIFPYLALARRVLRLRVRVHNVYTRADYLVLTAVELGWRTVLVRWL